MDPADLPALRAEIEGDPEALGYAAHVAAGRDADIATLLNAGRGDAEIWVPLAELENWLLVTSAYHMPRSVGAFRQAGWTVIAYPVDYRTTPRLRFGGSISFNKALRLLELASHEWAGLVAYYALGRTNAFFPAP